MITITRHLARQLLTVFKRALPRGSAALQHPVTFAADTDGLHVRLMTPEMAVAFTEASPSKTVEQTTVPLQALQLAQGSDKTFVTLEETKDRKVLVRWQDARVPQVSSFELSKDIGALPALPEKWQSCPKLLPALHQASQSASKDPIRFAVNRLQLRGKAGSIVASDGRQLLVQKGFTFPWEENVLIPASPIFASREIDQEREVQVGKTEEWVVLRIGAWTICLQIDKDGRYPDVDKILRQEIPPASSLSVAAEDAVFLARSLPRLPGQQEDNQPVTLELNGQICIRAKAAGQEQTTELVLSRSRYTGKPVSLCCDREFLARALQLSLTELQIGEADKPIICSGDAGSFVFVPLAGVCVVSAAADAIRLESATGEAAPPTPHTPPTYRTSTPMTVSQDLVLQDALSREVTFKPKGQKRVKQLSLLGEAQALRDEMKNGFRRASALVQALKQQRKQSQLVQTTLKSLRQLQTIDG